MRPLSRLLPAALALSVAAATLSGATGAASATAASEPVAPSPAVKAQGADAAKGRAARAPDSTVRTDTAEALPRPMRGRAAVRELGDLLPAVAALNDRSPRELRELLASDDTMWVAPSGRLFVKDEAPTVPPRTSSSAGLAPAAATYPLDKTFALHSLPGSRKTIFLDFDGVDVTTNAWTTQKGLPTGNHAGWDPKGDGAAFDDAERAAIQEVWARVAEDFAPFDIDVTTQDPGAAALTRTGSSDLDYGTHLVVTDSASAWSSLCGSSCGGVAWLGTFGASYPAGQYDLAWVFADGVADLSRYIAEAASHEIGHTLSLTHDGGADNADYHGGHTPWAPIMGGSYDQGVTQWSRGDYAGATNLQDDTAVVAARASLRADEAGDARATAALVPDGTAYVTTRDDVDLYALGGCTGPVTVTATPAVVGANLDLSVTVVDSAGASVAAAAPVTTQSTVTEPYPWDTVYTMYVPRVTGLGATVTPTVPTGRYYAAVTGVGAQEGGAGDPDTDYGSLGAYTLDVTGCSTAATTAPGAPTSPATTLTADGLVATWSAPASDGGADLVGYDVSLDGAAPERVGPGTTSRSWPEITTGTHSVSVVAVNGVGAGPAASASARRDRPGAPLLYGQYTQVDEFDGLLYFVTAFQPPLDDGGREITHFRFEYEIRPGVWQLVTEVSAEVPPDQILISHDVGVTLDPGAPPARMRVIAVNEVGDSEPLVVTGQIPGPPRLAGSITATPDKLARTLLVEWVDPYDGGSPLLDTTVAFMVPDDSYDIDSYALVDAQVVPAGTNRVLFTNVPAGEKLVAVEARNEFGSRRQGLYTEMPALRPPSWITQFAPVTTTYDRATSRGTATVSWTAPETDPDLPILGYDVVVDGGAPVRVTGTSHTITGLALGSTHTFTVAGVNAAGAGVPFGPPDFTVLAAPAPVTGIQASVDRSSPSDLSVTATWTASVDNGGVEGIPDYRWRLQPVGGAQAPWSSTRETRFQARGVAAGTYSLQVKAENARGGSATTSAPVTVLATATPGAVGGLAVRQLDPVAGTATLSWTAPDDGGSPVWAYFVTLVDDTTGDSWTRTAEQTSYALTGLVAGHAYRAEVRSQNNAGEGAVASVPFTVAGAPGPVGGLSALVDRVARTLTAAWSAPAQTGGAAVVAYEVRLDGGGWLRLSPGTTSHTFGGIGTGVHTVEVRADNGALDGAGQPVRGATASSQVSMPDAPVAPVAPGAVRGLTVVPDAAQGRVTLTWSAPADDGGAAVSDYVVVVGDRVLTAAGTSLTVSGLSLGTTYRVGVAARNSAGTGASSAQDVLLTTTAAAPRIGAAKPGKKGGRATAVFAWAPPTVTGGSSVTGYEVTIVTLKKGRVVASKTVEVAASKRKLEVKLKKKSRVTYAAVVRASNAVGWSPSSARSKAVAPR